MKPQAWIFTVRFAPTGMSKLHRHAVIGPCGSATVEAALHLAGVPEDLRQQIRSWDIVRNFVEGRLDPDKSGYYVTSVADDAASASWAIYVCIGSVQEILPR